MLLVIAIILPVVMMAACAPPSDSFPPGEEPTIEPNFPVSSDDTQIPAEEVPPIEGAVTYAEAVVESIQILMLESFPLQVHVAVQGSLPDSCARIYEITQDRDGNTFNVLIMTISPIDQECTDAEVPFQENIPLDVYGLPAGTYTVNVNGMTDTFTFDMDNAPPDVPPDNTGDVEGPITDLATIEAVEVLETAMAPPAVQVDIRGTVSDGCIGYLQIVEERQANIIRLTVGRNIPDGVSCAAVITEFEESVMVYDLEVGSYILHVNDFTVEFTVP
jgi:hypothetical protein